MNREEIAEQVAKELNLQVFKGVNGVFNGQVEVCKRVWDALISARVELAERERELAKCGKENCMGQEVEGCRRWVSEERLQKESALLAASEQRVKEMREALNRTLVHFCGQDDMCVECGEKLDGERACDTCYVVGRARAVLSEE